MLRTQITDAMKDALRAKDERTLATTRMIIAKMRDADIAARAKGVTDGIQDDEIPAMLQGMIKQRRESIAMYEKGNRADLVACESGEIAVIERFMPAQKWTKPRSKPPSTKPSPPPAPHLSKTWAKS